MATITTTRFAARPQTPHVTLRPFNGLGHADHGWLDARHHFSFASYYDPSRMGWGGIRVWNDDTIAAKSGFPPHPHSDMEIVTYVREGAITHRDSLGNLGRTAAGEVQVMSAGTGITHSEYNLEDTACRLFQIWIMPRTRGISPRWDQRRFPDTAGGTLTVLASGYDEPGALLINADARVLGGRLGAGQRLTHSLTSRDGAYLVLAEGSARICGELVQARDGIAIAPGTTVTVEASNDCEIVMVETRT